MTDLSDLKSRLPRLPLSTIIKVTLLLKIARFHLWLARMSNRYDGVIIQTARRAVESAEAVARKSDRLRRML
jgi:hypothetical protein